MNTDREAFFLIKVLFPRGRSELRARAARREPFAQPSTCESEEFAKALPCMQAVCKSNARSADTRAVRSSAQVRHLFGASSVLLSHDRLV